jgi:hypothetical protein
MATNTIETSLICATVQAVELALVARQLHDDDRAREGQRDRDAERFDRGSSEPERDREADGDVGDQERLAQAEQHRADAGQQEDRDLRKGFHGSREVCGLVACRRASCDRVASTQAARAVSTHTSPVSGGAGREPHARASPRQIVVGGRGAGPRRR